MNGDDPAFNRRQYPRVKAPVFFKTTRFFGSRRPVVDIGLGGMRVYSDEKFDIGKQMDIELFLPGDKVVRGSVRAVWIGLLPEGAPARYDVGLQIVALEGAGLRDLEQVLERV